MSALIIWYIGFLFCWGAIRYAEDIKGKKQSIWEMMSTTLLILAFWPAFLGALLTEIIDTHEKEQQRGKEKR